jgi:putative mRNA 3-end processing factor
LFYLRGREPIYASSLTFELTRLLISDFLRLSGYYLPYEYLDLDNLLMCSFELECGEERKMKSFRLKFLNAGHLPGSAQVLLRSKGSTLLYVGDFNTIDTRLLHGAEVPDEEIDYLIIESTYADEDHRDRPQLEKLFVQRLMDIIERGGRAVIPAFSVGRAQEILCVLAAHNFPYPIVLDGMARDASEILLRFSHRLRDEALFIKALRMARWIRGRRDRKKVLKKPCVIVAPAGMLKGGAADFYAQKLALQEENAIFLVGYQVPGTPGSRLLSEQKFIVNGKPEKVKAEVDLFDFSSHCGRRQLYEFVKQVEGDPLVFTVHGADGNCELLAKTIQEEIGLKAIAPAPEEVFSLGK